MSVMEGLSKSIAKEFKVKQDALSRIGQQKDIRKGILGNREYTWKLDTSKNDMLNAWSNQYFYFKDDTLKRIQNESLWNLGLDPDSQESKRQFNELLDQVLSPTDSHALKNSRHLNDNRVQGESLKFMMDLLGLETQHLEGRVSKITGIKGQGGLENPRFPQGEELQILRARIIGTVASDCQVRGSKGLIYFEKADERVDRFESTLREFGDIELKRKFRDDKGTYEIYINSSMAEAVMFWGIPEGDRTILNYGLPDDLPHWCEDAKRALIQDMISQEGCVSENGEISWNRRHALCAGNKSERYDFQSMLSDSAVKLLRESQTENRESGNAGEVYLTIGQLEELRKSDDRFKADAANEILGTVYDYRNKLIDDEVAIVTELGINVTLDPMQVSHYKRSGRVTVRWQARIRDNESKMKAVFHLRPNDARKSSILQDWLSVQSQKGRF